MEDLFEGSFIILIMLQKELQTGSSIQHLGIQILDMSFLSHLTSRKLSSNTIKLV